MSTSETPGRLPNKNTLQTLQPLLLALAVCIGIWAGLRLQNEPLLKRAANNTTALDPADNRIQEIMRYVEARYVDKIDKDSLSQTIVNTTFDQLDPHSSFISAAALTDADDDLEGSFDGIGVEFLMISDTLNILMTLNGSPAERAGIKPGDQFITVNDTLVAGPAAHKINVPLMLQGAKGSKVRIGLLRNGTNKLQNVVLVREQVLVKSIETAYMLDKQTGFIRIAQFSSTTYKEFLEALKRLTEQGMQDLVLDMRQNPGGFLDEAHAILNEFFQEKGKLMVFTEGRNSRKKEYTSTGRPNFSIKKVTLIIDEGTASASEIIAGAIQDWDRGPIVGRRSFGKGLVQEEYPLKSGGAIRLTVARYFTPIGRCLQRPYTDRQAYKRFLLNNDTEGSSSDTFAYKTSAGRKVFGGGGINPDFVLPADPYGNEELFGELQFLTKDFAYQYYRKNDKKLTDNFSIFNTKFSIDAVTYKDFIAYAIKKDAQFGGVSAAQWANYRTRLSAAIKANIARLKFNGEAYYIVLNESDPFVIKAYEVSKMKNPLRIQ